MSHAQQARISSEVCFVRAYAKVNLTLDVLSRLPDGYHELATVMQTIDLHDTICLTATDDQRVQVICTTPALSNNDNLAARAVDKVRQYLGWRQGVRIELYKRIPLAAGLGGGSSDAAAVLLALRQWWQLPFSAADLLSMAASLGSDVPFFLTGGLALCEGRGERVTPLAHYWPASMRWLLLLKPSILHFKSFNFGPLGSHCVNSSFSDSNSLLNGPRIVSSRTPLIDHGNKYGFGVALALNGSICKGMVFVELVSNVFLTARLQLVYPW